ncbi:MULTISPECIES: aldo/keto reductase [Streptomyces]|uniref:Oxidoreductase n=1 Tax=Streptomyces venezuelae (strain ATCC 10712 / CBS 650.69 / DSM 40230 / JCM 4526 / NBRC 13096 / PD 04745) TaxID=953739 RepID=F2R401_STRVP|nr:aldo/keto reductase [Streptomyces venezuelae]APE23989.1 aldo/keto reductase [Streptomyces venezuelae]QES01357.1 aldo/keto reductase [Streptomyces venezuelae ATCC 10712]CCA58373.1 oxidoreductase [Streptomyces venezuelae ATCC 10712]
MRQRALGDVRVGAIGLGAMPLSIEGHPDEARALATVHAALDAGVTLLDTADSYHPPGGEPGANELLVARALAAYGGRGRTEDVLVATKGGRGRTADGGWTVDGRPEHLRRAAEASARRLGVDAIGLYQLHKPDPAVPYAESLGAIRELLDAGTIRLAGISNVDTDRIRLAREILGERLVSVQNRYSPADRGSEPELRLCAELGLAFLPWSPLGGIARSSLDGASTLAADPEFGAFHRVARTHGVSPQRVALAWLLTRSATVLPIPGASRPESIRDSAEAGALRLTEMEIAELNGT